MKTVVVCGVGIKSISHFTRETEAAIKQADIVLHLVNEPATKEWIEINSKKNYPLEEIYYSTETRSDSYKNIVKYILRYIHEYNNVCLVVYGHPLLLSRSVSDLLSSIDRRDIFVTVLPSISSLDCLLSDLEVDPSEGMLSIEANVFLRENKVSDITNHLVIWQVGMINDKSSIDNGARDFKLKVLQEKLLMHYPREHEVIFYEASIYPHISPSIIKTNIKSMLSSPISRLTTAYIPPVV